MGHILSITFLKLLLPCRFQSPMWKNWISDLDSCAPLWQRQCSHVVLPAIPRLHIHDIIAYLAIIGCILTKCLIVTCSIWSKLQEGHCSLFSFSRYLCIWTFCNRYLCKCWTSSNWESGTTFPCTLQTQLHCTWMPAVYSVYQRCRGLFWKCRSYHESQKNISIQRSSAECLCSDISGGK